MRTSPEQTTARRGSWWLPGAVVALAGGLAGLAAKAADESGLGWAADLGTHPAAWVLVVVLLGRSAPGLPAAATRSSAFFLAMTLAYYVWADRVLGFGWDARLVGSWLALSLTAVPAVGAVAWWATRRSGLLPGALLALVAGVALAGGSVQRLWWVHTGAMPAEVGRPVQAAVDLVVVALLTVVLPRQLPTRLAALVLVLPMAGIAVRALDLLRQLLVLG